MANRDSVDAKRVNTFEEADAHGPGAFLWEERDGRRSMLFMMPGEDFLRSIEVNRGDALGNGVWGWDGDEEKPTLTPSILAYDRAGNGQRIEHWHGFLTAGRFVSC